MRLLTLYLRSRRAPAALLGAAGGTALMWALWSILSDSRSAGPQMVVLTVLLLVVALTATLGGPDDALEATSAFSWVPRRAVHLLVAFLVVVALVLVTLLTGARFGPAGLVVRDAAGLLGLTALGAATAGVARSWFVPLGWTLTAALFPQAETLAGRVLTWQAQEPGSTAAAVTAGALAVSGLIAYAMTGPLRGAPAEATQQ
ncbi:hypothetical protein AB0F72_20560 [Actinoplanes sp. NPDC023936]|uniref:hypothetical protein n=1 Tax=Actinoplanes sp. NPDC023936 TaxID=3154910 RepID=UPI0033E75586